MKPFTKLRPELKLATFGSHRNKITVIKHIYATEDDITAVPGTKILLIGQVDEYLAQMMEQLSRPKFQALVPICTGAYDKLRDYVNSVDSAGLNPTMARLNAMHKLYRFETYPPILILRNRLWFSDEWELAQPTNILLVGKTNAMKKYMLHHSDEFRVSLDLPSSTRTGLRSYFGIDSGRGRPSNEFLENGVLVD